MNDIKYLNPERTQELIKETKRRLGTKQDTIQVTTLPTASADYVGKVYQYIGVTGNGLTHNYFYECVESETPSTYEWRQTNVQSGSGSGSIVKGYRNPSNGKFYEEDTYTTLISGDDSTIYIDIPTKYQYDYNSATSTFTELGEKMPGLATEFDTGVVKPDDLTIFVDQTGTISTRVWAGTLAEYNTQKYRIPDNTAIIITDSATLPDGDTYVNGVKIVPWELGTDEDIAAMMQGHYEGKINIYDYWDVGDKRPVHLNATQSNVPIVSNIGEKTIDAILVNKGYGNNDVAFAVCLFAPSFGRIYSDQHISCDSWENTDIKSQNWFTDTLYNSLPTTIRSMFKPFDYICAASYDSNTTTTYNDYFTFFAEKELYGSRVYSTEAEANALSQISWFADENHRAFYDKSTIPSVTVMPEPSEEYVGKDYKYIGETTSDFKNGKYYNCKKKSDGTYKWQRFEFGRYWTRSITNSIGIITIYNRDSDELDRIGLSPLLGTSLLYVPFGCI